LIASFKATLEEARQADLLLHVADASNPAALQQIAAVYGVLEELGIREKDAILVLNQIDRIREPGLLEGLKFRYPAAIPVSARTGVGLARLAGAVSDSLTQHFLDVDVETDVANGRLLAYLARHGEILSRTYTGERVSIHCRLPRKYVGRIRPEDALIRPRIAASLHQNGHGNGHGNGNGKSNGSVPINGALHHNGELANGHGGRPDASFPTDGASDVA
jgi:GTPase